MGEIGHPDAVVRQDPRTQRYYNANAGPIRNAEMVDIGAAFCLAVHRDIANSKGTRDCARRAIAAKIPVWLIDAEDAEPRRITAKDLG